MQLSRCSNQGFWSGGLGSVLNSEWGCELILLLKQKQTRLQGQQDSLIEDLNQAGL